MGSLSRLTLFIWIVTSVGCAGAMGNPQSLQPAQPSPISRFDATGLRPRDRAVPTGGVLQFVNDDVRPHEIYSSDCRELASTPIAPGQVFIAQLEIGPKLCHFQDLLAPTSREFWGTVQVAEPTSPAVDFGDGM